SWGERSLVLAQRLPESDAVDVRDAHLLLGDVHEALARRESSAMVHKHLVDDAIERYRIVYAKNPSAAGLRLARLLSRECSEPDAALAILERLRQGRYSKVSITGDRLSLEFLEALGVVYHDAVRHKESVQLFQEALRRYAAEPEIHLHLGRAYAAVGKPREALDALQRAVRLAEERSENIGSKKRKEHFLEIA